MGDVYRVKTCSFVSSSVCKRRLKCVWPDVRKKASEKKNEAGRVLLVGPGREQMKNLIVIMKKSFSIVRRTGNVAI